MSVVTNKPRFFTEMLLKRLEIDAFFAGVIAGDDGIPRKTPGRHAAGRVQAHGLASPRARSCWATRRTTWSRRAPPGCPVWCVPYGYNEGRGPEDLACDRLVGTVDAAARLIVLPGPRTPAA
jgi:phosphoglycolate phosphatase